MKQINLRIYVKLLPLLMGMFLSLGVYAQDISIKGNVKDAYGEPIIGANIMVVGSSVGTITDLDGNFTLSAPEGSMISVSYVGYITQEVKAAPVVDITLQEDSQVIDDVVVIGYATGSQRTISGAVQKVGREEMNSGVVANPLAAMKGKVAGVNIAKTGGDPTASNSIRIRGTTSLTGGNDPLVIIDGVFADLAMLNAISPADIDNFTVLKDASETAQYGSRGASGVIVVTTVKGKSGVKSLSYDGSFGIESVYRNLDMLSAAQYRSVAQQRGINILDMGASTNFIKELQHTGYIQNHRISFSNGNEDGNYRVSVGVIDQKGIVKDNWMRNYTAKFDAMQNMFNNKLKLEVGIFASLKQNKYLNDYQKTFYSAAAYNPTFPNHKNAEGLWDENANANEVQNPLGRLEINDRESNAYINTNARITYSITNDLKVSAFGSFTYNVKENKKYIPMTIKAGQGSRGEAYRGDNKSQALLGNLMLTYKKAIGKNYLNFLGLGEIQKLINTGFGETVTGFMTDDFGYNNMKAGAILRWGDMTSYYNNSSLVSFMGRFNYSYDDRYIFTVNARGDASSKFGSNNKWAFFPSASAAWVLKEETFLKDVSFLSNLKLRAGYGWAGNQDAISSYNSLLLYEPFKSTTVNGTPYIVPAIVQNYNPDLKWEIKKTFDIGIDAGFFEERLTFVFDYYNSKTDDLLYTYNVSVPPFAFDRLLANLGSMRNTGIELAIGVVPLRNKDMELSINANVSFQRNKLLSLSGNYMGQELTPTQYMSLGGMNGAGFIGGANQIIYQLVGQPVGVFYLPKSDGLEYDASKGGYVYKTLDIDGKDGINYEDGADRYIAGQAMPKTYLGANINFKWKQFDVVLQMNGAFGQKIYNGTSLTYMNMEQYPTYNVMKDAPSRNIMDQTVTDYWLEKGDYLHFDYVTVGWNLDCRKMKYLKSLRVTFSVNNLATITSYSGLSPMINSSVVSGDLGIDDKRFYPLSRTYSLGLSINF